MLAEDALLVVNIVLLAAVLPLTIIAFRGFRGSPWGRVLQPLPVIAVGYLTSRCLAILHVDGELVLLTMIVSLGVAVAATALHATRLAFLLTGRRAM